VIPATDFISGDLYLTLYDALVAAAAAPSIAIGIGDYGVQVPSPAVQGSASVSGLCHHSLGRVVVHRQGVGGLPHAGRGAWRGGSTGL